MTTPVDAFDPLSAAYLDDPQAAVQSLLAGSPVFFHDPLNSFVVTRNEDVRAVLTDFETFSSGAYKAVEPTVEALATIPDEHKRVAQLVIGGGVLLNLDPPVHTRERKAAQKAFTRPRVSQASADIAAKADALIDGFADRGSIDLMQDFAYQLTLSVVGDMLGLPSEDLPRFHAWIGEVFSLMSPIDAEPGTSTRSDEDIVDAYARMYSAYEFFSAFVADRRENPGDDITSAMLKLTDDEGEPLLSNDSVLAHMVSITAAGTDTTANLIGNTVRQLTENPGLLAEVRADEDLWEHVVEESLRRTGIGLHLFRYTTRDTEIRGVPIPARSMVLLNIAAANADPSVFPDPLVYDINRPNLGEHLAFGTGRHFCIGSPLARPEASIALRTLYRRLPGLKADLEEKRNYLPALTVRAVLNQTVTWEADSDQRA
ncbi:MAG TPA: cytochrome P450 [Streptomyces sp.]|uniref:cytochrome P450 n=1 Tax=Streptomyces sp. TaxID=1931 RepID=UPI002C2D807D|nr:cytochrome P450 [Streptomyces sp.]HWU08073.1 cytochrome P450 [Streptomyces sp.]